MCLCISFLFFFYGRKFGWRSGVYLFLLAVALVGFTDQVTNLFKNGFMRLRPCHEEHLAESMRLVKEGCGGLYSFFFRTLIEFICVSCAIQSIFSAEKKRLCLFYWFLQVQLRIVGCTLGCTILLISFVALWLEHYSVGSFILW